MDSASTGRNVLLSIKPRFANAILCGEKRVELRRVVPTKEIETVVLYSTTPDQAIVGWFEVNEIEVASPSKLWKQYGPVSSLTRREFYDYFRGCQRGIAFCIGTMTGLTTPLPLDIFGSVNAPQSFSYLADDAVNVLRQFDGKHSAKACFR